MREMLTIVCKFDAKVVQNAQKTPLKSIISLSFEEKNAFLL